MVRNNLIIVGKETSFLQHGAVFHEFCFSFLALNSSLINIRSERKNEEYKKVSSFGDSVCYFVEDKTKTWERIISLHSEVYIKCYNIHPFINKGDKYKS